MFYQTTMLSQSESVSVDDQAEYKPTSKFNKKYAKASQDAQDNIGHVKGSLKGYRDQQGVCVTTITSLATGSALIHQNPDRNELVTKFLGNQNHGERPFHGIVNTALTTEMSALPKRSRNSKNNKQMVISED